MGLPSNIIPLQFILQSLSGDTQSARGLALVTAGLFQGLEDQQPLRFLQGRGRAGIILRLFFFLFLNGQGKALFTELIAAHENHPPFNGIFQFPHVSRPSILDQQFHAARSHRLHRAAVLLRKLADKMGNEQGDIALTLTQRRDEQDRVTTFKR